MASKSKKKGSELNEKDCLWPYDPSAIPDHFTGTTITARRPCISTLAARLWHIDEVSRHEDGVDMLRSIHRSVPRFVVPSLVTSLVLSRLDCGNATQTGIPQHLLRRLQSVMNAAAWLIYSSSRFEHILHSSVNSTGWRRRREKAKERIDFKLAVLVFKCVHGSAPPYLTDELSRPADSQARCRLRSASSHILVVRRTNLTTVGDRSFPVAASRVWNNLPQHIISSPSLQVFKNRLKTHLFSFSFP